MTRFRSDPSIDIGLETFDFLIKMRISAGVASASAEIHAEDGSVLKDTFRRTGVIKLGVLCHGKISFLLV
ncbi:MAG TPA: hypothetical protein PKV84_00755 [Candidatus Omnitrophota bacterium]|nr:hypothetical protein [Candidatus Omnitrophota bacterium]